MSYLKQAVKLVQDGDRYSGHGRLLSDFIDEWAYRQTGLYPPSRAFSEEENEVASQLSRVIHSAWEAQPGEDFIGHVIEECGGSGHLSFFRTPPALSILMSRMMGVRSGLEDFSDICCGTGSLTLARIYQTFLDGGARSVARLNITGEDLSASKVKVTMLQVLNLLEIIGNGQPLYVHSLNLSEVNSLTRERGRVQYIASGINNAHCRLSKEQRQLVREALSHRIPFSIISERLRIPINLIRKAQKDVNSESGNCLRIPQDSSI